MGERRGTRVTDGQRAWLRVRGYLQRHRYELGEAAAGEYPDAVRVAGTGLLTRPEWLPRVPIPLEGVHLEFAPDVPFHGLTGSDPVTGAVRPERPDGSRYPTYAAAMAELAAPAVFENRPTYRLLAANLAGSCGHLTFGRGRYFDGIDIGEAAAHEYAAARPASDQAAGHAAGQATGRGLRTAVGDPCDPARRPTNLAIGMLTVRHDRDAGDARFLLHWRDPAKVGHAGGLYMVVPVGVFQAADGHPGSERRDFSLWRCMVREYAEELLGEPEHHDPAGEPVDYASRPFAVRMTDALHAGRIRTHVLGIGVDALTFATDLLTVVVFDAPIFDELFGDLVHVNAEGRLVGATAGRPAEGFPLRSDQLDRLAGRPVQAAGAATLNLALRHRELLQLPPG